MQALQTFEFQGCKLAYRISGAGPPLLMIQGVGAFGASGWNPQIEILERSFTCLNFDSRGLGASQPAARPLTVEQMAADALALIEHAGWDSAHIVGHSLGGLVALELALTDKSRVRSLSLLNTFARGDEATRANWRLFWIAVRLRFGTLRMRRKAFMELVVSPGDTLTDKGDLAKRISAVFGHDIGEVPPFGKHQLRAMRRHNVTARLGELAGIPTLVISGEKDPIARPELGRAIAAGIPGARYIEIPGASHAFPVIEAERCAALLLEHINAAELARLPQPGTVA